MVATGIHAPSITGRRKLTLSIGSQRWRATWSATEHSTSISWARAGSAFDSGSTNLLSKSSSRLSEPFAASQRSDWLTSRVEFGSTQFHAQGAPMSSLLRTRPSHQSGAFCTALHLVAPNRFGLVHNLADMPVARKRRRPLESRLSVSLRQEQHDALDEIAEANHVTAAWVVRLACDKLIEEYHSGQLTLPIYRVLA
jgi:hypothetical protein